MTFHHFINGMINMSPLKLFRSKVYSIKNQALFSEPPSWVISAESTHVPGTPTLSRVSAREGTVSPWEQSGLITVGATRQLK